MIKCILWDNDGVLVDTEKLFFRATRETLATVGIDLTSELFAEFSLIRGEGLEEYLNMGGIDPSHQDYLRKMRNMMYSKLLSAESTLFSGVTETLQYLHGQYKMGIVTSSRRDHFDIIHHSTGILKYFNFILTREDYKNSKPDPEPYLLALENAEVEKHECIVVEDSARGLLSANRAGLFCLMIPNELSLPETYTGNFRQLRNIRDVPGILNQEIPDQKSL